MDPAAQFLFDQIQAAQSTGSYLVARRQYPQLSWKRAYQAYYQRDWQQEQRCLDDQDEKQASSHSHANWTFHRRQHQRGSDSSELNKIPKWNSLCDVGRDGFVSIGGKNGKVPFAEVYRIRKDLRSMQKVSTSGAAPCCRWAHSAEFLPSLNAIFFFGGFDSKCNFNDARLLFVDSLAWHELSYGVQIDVRAFHSTASRLLTQRSAGGTVQHKAEVLLFGGQFCNGGPYEYHNDLFKFTFVQQTTPAKNTAHFEVEKMHSAGDEAPCARSMSFAWIKGDALFIFGGSCATRTLNDLWTFDLTTRRWSQIGYRGLLGAPKTHRLTPKPFRISGQTKPCYFNADMEQLIVLHYGALGRAQREFTAFEGSYDEFREAKETEGGGGGVVLSQKAKVGGG